MSISDRIKVEDQEHPLNGSILEFPLTPLQLNPNVDIFFLYTLKLSDGGEVPSGLISFDQTKLEFSVGSEDQSMVGEYNISVSATSDDPRLSG